MSCYYKFNIISDQKKIFLKSDWMSDPSNVVIATVLLEKKMASK